MSGRLQPPPRIPAKGLLLLAIGRKTGFDHFGGTNDAYLGSLAPLLAMILVSTAWLGVRDHAPHQALAVCLRLVCMLLAPVVIADLFCRVWKRNGQWALYANLLNWAQFLSWFILVLVLFAAQLGIAAGMDQQAALIAAGLVLVAYLTWFHWFLARQTLAVSRRRVLLLMLISGAALLAINATELLGDQAKSAKSTPPALLVPDSAATNGSTL
jgi:hypothetical protein